MRPEKKHLHATISCQCFDNLLDVKTQRTDVKKQIVPSMSEIVEMLLTLGCEQYKKNHR